VNQVTVNGPEAIFEAQGGAQTFPQGATIQFFNNSNTANSTNPLYSWNFGDGNMSIQVDPTHVYAQPGTYTVMLTAQDGADGCVSIMSLVITIQAVNNAFSKSPSYVASSSCPPVLVQFTNTSANYLSYTWNFGDGESVSNVPNPSHVYQNPGTFIVTLTVLGANQQTTTTIDSVVVLQPSAVLSTAVPAVCVGQSMQLQSTGNQRVKSYSWDFGDGTVVSGTDSTASHIYATGGIYTTKLVVTDSVGCSVAAAAANSIDVHPPPVVRMTPATATICLGKGVTIEAIGGINYSWSPATGLSDSSISAPVASPTVNTKYMVTVADKIGCTNTDSIAVSVVRPDTVTVSPDSAAICPGKTVPLQASGSANYQWIGTVAGLSATNIANPVAQPDSSTVYRAVGSDTYGCFTDTVPVIVTVLQQPVVNAGPNLIVQALTPVTIQAQGSGDIVSWQWTPASFLSCADCQQPVCTPNEPESYKVTVTAKDGCVASDSVSVQLLCDEIKIYIPEAFTPNNDGHNDRWRILGAISEVNHLVIYDRWGAKVFEQDHFYPADPSTGWDGTTHGRLCPAGIYVYFVEMKCPAGAVFTRKGTVVLVR
jgi:gliding motility-associated-like protein